MSISDYLKRYDSEQIPAWLGEFEPGMPFPRASFFESRIVYYPGALYDGHAVKVFGAAGAAHCFVYVDFAYSLEELCDVLDSEEGDARNSRGFLGYHSLCRLDVTRDQLLEGPWSPPNIILNYPVVANRARSNPFAILEVLKRNGNYGDAHGPEKLAILFIAGCGFATFHALFTQNPSYKPFGILVQDDNFSENPRTFGRDGLLNNIAEEYGKLPKYLLVTDRNAWNGYRRIENLDAESGGGHNQRRSLFIQDSLLSVPTSF